MVLNKREGKKENVFAKAVKDEEGNEEWKEWRGCRNTLRERGKR